LSHGTGKGVFVKISSSSNSHRNGRETELGEIENSIFGESFDTGKTPVIGVLGGCKVNFVILGEGLGEKGSEFIIILGVHGVASHAGVTVFNSRQTTCDESHLLFFGQG
jgi:hypothetical protein